MGSHLFVPQKQYQLIPCSIEFMYRCKLITFHFLPFKKKGFNPEIRERIKKVLHRLNLKYIAIKVKMYYSKFVLSSPITCR